MTTSEEALDLAAIQARADAATSGPWEVVVELDGAMAGRRSSIKASDGFTRRRVVTVGQTRPHHHGKAESNIEFIAHAREDIPVLLAYVRSLVAERDEAEAKLAQVREWCKTHEYFGSDMQIIHDLRKLVGAEHCYGDAILAQPDDKAATDTPKDTQS